MVQSHIYGKDRIEYMESMIVGDVQALGENQGTLSLFTTEEGKICGTPSTRCMYDFIKLARVLNYICFFM